jgi:hypothetical protein
MDLAPLKKWLAEPRTALAEAVAAGVHTHVGRLRSRGTRIDGYALLPGEPYELGNLVVVVNSEEDIRIPNTDPRYAERRYHVDEWDHWEHGEFSSANLKLAELNQRFEIMSAPLQNEGAKLDLAILHDNASFDAIVSGLETARVTGAFGDVPPFLVVWISDSSHHIIYESVRRLNSREVADEFDRLFG